MILKNESLPLEYSIVINKEIEKLSKKFFVLLNKGIHDKYSNSIELNEINKEKLKVYEEIFRLDRKIERIINLQKELRQSKEQEMEVQQLLRKRNTQSSLSLVK